MIIGLSGYARSGKDSVANILVEEYGFERRAFADKLREALYQLNPVIIDLSRHALDSKFLQDIVYEHGWDGLKSTHWGPEVRRLLQRMGTEVGRNVLGDNIWVEAAFRDLKPLTNYVFTDCRFVNEATKVKRVGQVWRVSRPGVGPANDHISEIGLDNWEFDVRIDNDGTLTDLRESVSMLMQR